MTQSPHKLTRLTQSIAIGLVLLYSPISHAQSDTKYKELEETYKKSNSPGDLWKLCEYQLQNDDSRAETCFTKWNNIEKNTSEVGKQMAIAKAYKYYAQDLNKKRQRSELEAKKWYTKASDNGNAQAKACLQNLASEECNPKRLCFLTTACVTHMGKNDDCDELTRLRAFRDHYMLSFASGADEVAKYERLGPQMVAAIEASPDRSHILTDIYERLVQPALALIRANQLSLAFQHYRRYTLDLEQSLGIQA